MARLCSCGLVVLGITLIAYAAIMLWLPSTHATFVPAPLHEVTLNTQALDPCEYCHHPQPQSLLAATRIGAPLAPDTLTAQAFEVYSATEGVLRLDQRFPQVHGLLSAARQTADPTQQLDLLADAARLLAALAHDASAGDWQAAAPHLEWVSAAPPLRTLASSLTMQRSSWGVLPQPAVLHLAAWLLCLIIPLGIVYEVHRRGPPADADAAFQFKLAVVTRRRFPPLSSGKTPAFVFNGWHRAFPLVGHVLFSCGEVTPGFWRSLPFFVRANAPFADVHWNCSVLCVHQTPCPQPHLLVQASSLISRFVSVQEVSRSLVSITRHPIRSLHCRKGFQFK